MPVFVLEKLVRNELLRLYREMEQDAAIRMLEDDDLIVALKNKFEEEVDELPGSDDGSGAIASELADIRQVVINLAERKVDIAEAWAAVRSRYPTITDEEIEERRIEKNVKKGDFSEGVYIVTLALKDGDPWIEYYRREPDKYPEVEE